ncbi:hypothetical protein COUCH_02275 [Couchioplanes caeruleus]|uniref:hypothetical protein n=1 Tax=Couchioplanes caeruleus TaxID=56438 RepID=UPI0020BF5234|nr:hypothetical protein [Couchioplanes caeruleus]UQU65198.1 hypothetical protein COUCH_02275 [Couchioplanes caeruleus]
MLSRLMDATARHRRLIVAVELAVAVVLVVLNARRADVIRTLFPWEIGVALLGGALAIAAFNRRPRTLEVAPDLRAFVTPAGPGTVFLLGAWVPIASSNIGSGLRDLADREDLWQLDLASLVCYGVALLLLVRTLWISPGLELRHDGMLDRSVAGSLFVPWEAFALDRPACPTGKPGQVAFAYRNPELVRRRGLPRGREQMTVTGVDLWFLSRAIHHYVTQPAFRAAIGTDVEYRRLRQSLQVTPERG